MDEALHEATGGSLEEEAAVMFSEPIVAAYKSYLLDLPLTLAEDSLRFLAHRLEKQAALLSELAACETLTELVETQVGFLNAAFEDYGQEARTVVRHTRQAVR
jgi:hypothetical protein